MKIATLRNLDILCESTLHLSVFFLKNFVFDTLATACMTRVTCYMLFIVSGAWTLIILLFMIQDT